MMLNKGEVGFETFQNGQRKNRSKTIVGKSEMDLSHLIAFKGAPGTIQSSLT